MYILFYIEQEWRCRCVKARYGNHWFNTEYNQLKINYNQRYLIPLLSSYIKISTVYLQIENMYKT
jgi:hypothetical protein